MDGVESPDQRVRVESCGHVCSERSQRAWDEALRDSKVGEAEGKPEAVTTELGGSHEVSVRRWGVFI